MMPSVNVTPIAPSAITAPVRIPSASACIVSCGGPRNGPPHPPTLAGRGFGRGPARSRGLQHFLVPRACADSSTSAAEKRFSYERFVEQRTGGTGEAVTAFGQHVAAVGHAQRGLRVLFHHQDRDSRFGESTKLAEDFFDDARREPRR